jgi:hypothetical protein
LDDVEIYTAGWGLSPDPSYLYDLWSPKFAPTACGGGWTTVSPTNYICYVNANTELTAVKFAPTITAGYAAGTASLAKFLADLPMYPLYSVNGARPVALTDQTAPGPLTTSTPAWRDVVNFKDRVAGTGFGPDSFDSFKNMQYASSGRSGFSPSAVIDYGFRFPIIKANPITSQFLWDFLLMGLAYESLIVRDTSQLFSAQCQDITICSDSNAGAWVPEMALNSPSYNAAGPFDPVTTAADPSKDWSTYTYTDTTGTHTASYIRFRLPIGANAIHWTNGDPFIASDVKFSIEYTKLVQGFNSPSVQDERVVIADDAAGLVTVELTHQSAWIRNDIGAGYLLVNHKAFGTTTYDPTLAFSKPDSSFKWATPANHITLGPWVMASISTTGGQHLLLPNSPSTPAGTGSCVLACPGFNKEARLTVDPDVNRDGTVNISDFVGLLSRFGNSITGTWDLNTNAQGANSPRADINNDGTVNIKDFTTFLQYNGLTYPCPVGTELKSSGGTLSCASI